MAAENRILELSITKEQYFRQKAIDSMTSAISKVLADNQPSIYLYGSSVLNDFRLGWSDIDILVLTQKRISQPQAQELVMLRQKLLENEVGNPYYRSFEGGMLTLSAFISKKLIVWFTGEPAGSELRIYINLIVFAWPSCCKTGNCCME